MKSKLEGGGEECLNLSDKVGVNKNTEIWSKNEIHQNVDWNMTEKVGHCKGPSYSNALVYSMLCNTCSISCRLERHCLEIKFIMLWQSVFRWPVESFVMKRSWNWTFSTREAASLLEQHFDIDLSLIRSWFKKKQTKKTEKRVWWSDEKRFASWVWIRLMFDFRAVMLVSD